MEFYDVSTPSGKLRLYLNRIVTWRWLPALVGAVVLVGVVAVVGTASSSGPGSADNVLESSASLQGGQPILKAAGGVKGKSVPPWLPGFLDTFPWINKTVIDKLNGQVDPNWGTWPTGPNFVQSTGGLKAVPGAGGANKGIPDWLPGFLDNFPWINKTVVDKLNDRIAAQTAYQVLQGVLKATAPGAEPVGPKPVPAWLPDFLNNFPWINKTVIDKLNERVDPEDEAEGVNTLKLKLAVEEVADNSAVVDKGVPAWLPGFLDNFPWINKTVIDTLNNKVAPTGPLAGGNVLMSTAPLTASGGKNKTVPPWLPGFLDGFPWINKTVIVKLNDEVDPAWASWEPAYGGPVLQSSAVLKDPTPSVVGPTKTIPEWLPGFLDEFPWVNKSVIYKIDAVIKAQEAKDKALMVNATPILKAIPGAGGKNKTIPAWLPDFLNNFPWINKTVIDRLNDFKEPLAEDDEPQSYNMLKLKLAFNEVAEESKATKPIPPWLPGFLDNFITNKTIIDELNDKVATQGVLQTGSTLKLGAGEINAPGDNLIPSYTIQPKPGTKGANNGTFQFWGDGTTVFDKLNSPWINKTAAKTVVIHNFAIDAAALTADLKDTPDLETLLVEASSVSGQFSPVTLPKLQSFKFTVGAGSGSLSALRDPMMLNSLLFVRKTPIAATEILPTTETTPIFPDIPSTVIEFDGVKIIDIEQDLKQIMLNVPYCEAILENQTLTGYTKMGLFKCPLSKPLALPSSLTHLNLNDAFPPDQASFDQMMASLKSSSLTELHLYSPPIFTVESRQLILDVADIPASVTKLSLSNVGLRGTGAATGVTDLTLERSNVTGVVDHIETVFPNVKTLSLFDVGSIPDGKQYQLMNKMITLRPASVQVSGMVRSGSSSGVDADQDAVEAALTALRVLPTATDFTINYSGAATQFSQPLTDSAKNYRRFSALGYGDIDSYAAYLKYDNAGGASIASVQLSFICLIVVAFFWTRGSHY